jgi:pimeloyl-ACP methyl ester carboxylesterase
MRGQIYVQRWVPASRTNRRPIVMIPGGGQTGANFERTADGRPGWAPYFVGRGYEVYVVDQPARGRSVYHTDQDGNQRLATTVSWTEQRFTATARFNLWPQAHLHSQWPGTGLAGDPSFDQFYSSQVSWLEDYGRMEQMMRSAGAALLDEIGAAIVLCHSQSGSVGWQIGDARPDLVKALVAVEPNGPPFFDVEFVGPPEYFREGRQTRPWGVSATPLTYEPPVASESGVSRTRQESPGPGFVSVYLQDEPVRTLANLRRVPVLIVTGEASYHSTYDHGTVSFLRQAGVPVTHLNLAGQGITGNGHMMMLEVNSDDIAAAINGWIEDENLAFRTTGNEEAA